jgi:transcriptional regulator with XRE-family HTH domain
MSGDVERDAELFGNEERYPPHLRRPPAKVLSINQLVSYNMWRARRASTWTQQEVAELLEKYTGRTWSNASVSAAERAWQGGRPRRFDASEIVALAKIFDEPMIYFFMPDEMGNYYANHVGMTEFPDGTPNMDPESRDNDLMSLIPVDEYVQWIGMYQLSPAFDFRMRELVMRFTHLSWTAPDWKMPLKVGGLPDAPPASTEPLPIDQRVTFRIDPLTGEKEAVVEVTQEELTNTVKRLMRELTDKVVGEIRASSSTPVAPQRDRDVSEDA